MIRCQELFDGQVRKLHHPRFSVDDGDQTRTRGQNSAFLVVRPPVRVELWNAPLSSVEVKREDFRQLLNTKRPDSNCKAVKEAASVFSVCPVDILQNAFIRLVQGPW
jgi:hypothetical protein